MPDFLRALLMQYADQLWMAFLGFLGAVVRVAVLKSRGEPMPPSLMMASMISGAVMAGTSNSMLSSYIGVTAAGFSCFVIGLIAMNIVAQIMAAQITIPFLPSKKE